MSNAEAIEKKETSPVFPALHAPVMPLYPFASPKAANGVAPANGTDHGLEHGMEAVKPANPFADTPLVFQEDHAAVETPTTQNAKATVDAIAADVEAITAQEPIKVEVAVAEASVPRPPVGLPLIPEPRPTFWQTLPFWSKYAMAAAVIVGIHFAFMALIDQDRGLKEFRERNRAAAPAAITAAPLVEKPVVSELSAPEQSVTPPAIESINVREVPVKSLESAAKPPAPPAKPATKTTQTPVAAKKAVHYPAPQAQKPSVPQKTAATPKAPLAEKPATSSPMTVKEKPSEEKLLQLLNRH
jgi:hypothetical protein